MKYELKTSDDGLREYVLRYNEDGTISDIPADLANSSYQQYLTWLENPEAEQSTLRLVNSDKQADPVV